MKVDFTSCARVPGRAYNGANGKKIAVSWQGACWILKFPPSAAERPNDLSYSNSCFSEHIASTIFDCGSCLLPQADEKVMRLVLDDERELEARIFTFPSSMLKIDGEKVNYAKILASPPGDLKEAVGRILPRIDLGRICAFIDDVPYLTDLQRTFYKCYLTARRQKLFGEVTP